MKKIAFNCRFVHARLAPLLFALAVLTWSVPYTAWAHSGGMSGSSGKSGSYCSSCHHGGTAPTVAISGPNSLATGTSAEYTFTITGGPAVVGGLDVAVSSGTLIASDPTTSIKNGEVTQNTADSFSGNTLTYTFTLNTPLSAGTVTIYAAGLSADGNGGTSGDGAADTTYPVVVSAPALTSDPQISIADSVSPTDDHQIPFGNVLDGLTSDQTVTITNTGGADLTIGTIGGADPLASPFSIPNVSDACSNTTLAPAESCSLIIEFAPVSTGTSTDAFDIPSNDPSTPSAIISVSGTGTTSMVNNPPTAPVLISPTDGSTGVGTTTTLKWTKSTDPDGDTVSYHLYVDTDSAFTSTVPVDLAGRATGIYFAGSGLFLFGFVLARRGRGKALVLMLMMLSLLTFGSLVACSSNSSTLLLPNSTTKSYRVTGLTSGTTYYWKVVADDGRGGLTASQEVWSFTAQ